MKILRRLLIVILLIIPAVKFAQSNSEDIDYQSFEIKESGYEAVKKSGAGRVFVFYGTGQHRPYHGQRYYYRKGYPYAPYTYRYYYYPYQRPVRYYNRGG